MKPVCAASWPRRCLLAVLLSVTVYFCTSAAVDRSRRAAPQVSAACQKEIQEVEDGPGDTAISVECTTQVATLMEAGHQTPATCSDTSGDLAATDPLEDSCKVTQWFLENGSPVGH